MENSHDEELSWWSTAWWSACMMRSAYNEERVRWGAFMMRRAYDEKRAWWRANLLRLARHEKCQNPQARILVQSLMWFSITYNLLTLSHTISCVFTKHKNLSDVTFLIGTPNVFLLLIMWKGGLFPRKKEVNIFPPKFTPMPSVCFD